MSSPVRFSSFGLDMPYRELTPKTEQMQIALSKKNPEAEAPGLMSHVYLSRGLEYVACISVDVHVSVSESDDITVVVAGRRSDIERIIDGIDTNAASILA